MSAKRGNRIRTDQLPFMVLLVCVEVEAHDLLLAEHRLDTLEEETLQLAQA